MYKRDGQINIAETCVKAAEEVVGRNRVKRKMEIKE